jgi:hypothetical protein
VPNPRIPARSASLGALYVVPENEIALIVARTSGERRMAPTAADTPSRLPSGMDSAFVSWSLPRGTN